MKATNSLLKILLTKNLPPSMFIKLFDQTIVPILTYASEIWGTFSLQSKTVFDDFGNLTPEKHYLKTGTEETCLYFYKRLLMVNKKASNLATLGELGRCPIHIIIIIRIIKFWYRIKELEENSLLKETLNERLRAQNTKKNTSNLATLGELGRYPIQIIMIIRIITLVFNGLKMGKVFKSYT